MSNLVANKVTTAPYKDNYGQWQYVLASCVIVPTASVHKWMSVTVCVSIVICRQISPAGATRLSAQRNRVLSWSDREECTKAIVHFHHWVVAICITFSTLTYFSLSILITCQDTHAWIFSVLHLDRASPCRVKAMTARRNCSLFK